MKNAFWMAAILLLSSLWLVAQTTSGSHSQSDHTMNHKTIEGCLGGSASNYTLTEKSGKVLDVRGDSTQVAEHIGQEVRITGTEQHASNSTSNSTTSSTSSSMPSRPSLEVSNIEKMSDTCTTK